MRPGAFGRGRWCGCRARGGRPRSGRGRWRREGASCRRRCWPEAMRLAPVSSQSPAASASIRFRGTFGSALKSKVASVLPPGRRDSFRWRWMRRVSRSASSHQAEGCEEAGRWPVLLVGLLGEGLPAPGEAGQAQRREHRRQGVDVDLTGRLTGGHARASSSASKLASAVRATGTSAGRPRPRGSSLLRRSCASGTRSWARSQADQVGELGLAALVVGECEEAHHAPASLLLGPHLGQARPGSGILLTGEQAVAEDRAGERLRLALEGHGSRAGNRRRGPAARHRRRVGVDG